MSMSVDEDIIAGYLVNDKENYRSTRGAISNAMDDDAEWWEQRAAGARALEEWFCEKFTQTIENETIRLMFGDLVNFGSGWMNIAECVMGDDWPTVDRPYCSAYFQI